MLLVFVLQERVMYVACEGRGQWSDKSLFTKYVRIEGGETREEKREEFSKEWKELLRKRDTQL